MCNPGAVKAVAGLALLVFTHLGQRYLVHGGVPAAGDKGGHPADRVRAPFMTRLDKQIGVGTHEGNGHGDLGAVGEDAGVVGPELLDQAEDVVPTARVETAAWSRNS